MAFEQFRLDKSVNQSRGIYDKYIYKTDDAVTEVSSVNYFEESRFSSDPDWAGSIIECQCSDGYVIGLINEFGTLSALYDSTAAGAGMPIAPTGGTFLANGASWEDSREQISSALYDWSTDTTATDPGAGVIKGNNSDLGLVTELYLSDTTNNSFNYEDIIDIWDEDDFIVLNRLGNQDEHVIYRVMSVATDNGSWHTLQVEVSSNNGTFPDSQELQVNYIPTSTRPTNLKSLGREIIVRSLDDLPAPVGGFIDLDDNTQYLQVDDIDFGSTRVRYSKARYTGLGTNVVTATYSGNDALFNCTGESTLDNISIDCPNGSPLDWTSTGAVIMRWDNSTVVSCDRAATFTANGGAVRMGNVTYRDITTNGHVLTGTFISFNYETAGIFIDAGDIFDITAATFVLFFNLQNLVVALFPTGTVFIRGLAASANFGSAGQGLVQNVRLLGPGTPLVGVQTTDIQWDFFNNPQIENSSKVADTFLLAQETVTINTSGVFVPINGGNWQSDVAERFTTNANGELTYVGFEPSKFLIICSSTIEKVGGGADQLETRIAVNGVTTGDSFTKSGAVTENNRPTNVTSIRVETLSSGDVVQAYVANNTDINNVIVNRSNLSLINGF